MCCVYRFFLGDGCYVYFFFFLFGYFFCDVGGIIYRVVFRKENQCRDFYYVFLEMVYYLVVYVCGFFFCEFEE